MACDLLSAAVTRFMRAHSCIIPFSLALSSPMLLLCDVPWRFKGGLYPVSPPSFDVFAETPKKKGHF